jgi:hypothetical protein
MILIKIKQFEGLKEKNGGGLKNGGGFIQKSPKGLKKRVL